MELKEVDIEEIELNKKAARNKKRSIEFLDEEEANPYDMSDKVSDNGNNRAGKGFLIFGLILFLISITILAGVFLMYKTGMLVEAPKEDKTEKAVTYTQEEVNTMLAGAINETRLETEEKVRTDFLNTLHEATSVETGTWNLLRKYFPDEVVFTDGNKYTYVGVNKSLKLNSLDNNNFSRDPLTGYLKYINPDGTSNSHMGIDVSTFQKKIDWEQVKASGIEFAIIRCGIRGYGSQGRLVEDSCFREHIEGALNAGLEVGVYFFTQAITTEEAVEEAEYVLELIDGYDINGPIAIDVEAITTDVARTDGLTGEEITDNVAAFCERIKESGHRPLIYSGLRYFVRKMDMEKLEPYEKWYAYYNDPLYFPYEISVWQYSMTGSVPGIEGDVDLNIIFDKWW